MYMMIRINGEIFFIATSKANKRKIHFQQYLEKVKIYFFQIDQLMQ